MNASALAPSNNNAGRLYHHLARGATASAAGNLVKVPRPCAQNPNRSPPAEDPVVANGAAYAGHDRTSRHSTYEAYKSASVSSAGGSSLMTPMSSIDLEKSRIARPQPTRQHNRDPEKAMQSERNDTTHRTNTGDAASMGYMEDDSDDDGRQRQEENAVKIILFLSGPCVLVSALNTFWAFISLLITILTQPVRLCAKRPTFSQQLAGLLGPALNLQLRCIYTPLPPYANEDSSYHTLMLLVVHILSPFLSLGMMVVAWVLAVYWVSSVVVGDPAGMDKADDGRDTVLWLRGWWESWLLRGVKEQ